MSISYSDIQRNHRNIYNDQHNQVAAEKSFTEDNVCGRELLTIVARGNAIITELYRLTELIPVPFKQNDYESQQLDESKKLIIDSLICDFGYFKNSDGFETRIETDETLKKADENFCDNYIDILTRFYLTFESVYRYANDLNNFIVALEDEMFVGQTIDGLLADFEGRQLLSEAYYLLGYMLMATDENFEGTLRERLIVSYYRYSSYKSAPDSNVDNTCNLLRDTGFRCRQQQIYRTSKFVQYYRPEGYPESFFARAGVSQSVLNLLISKMQAVDIYNQTSVAHPHPDHRSAALSHQASMLYVILYFCPSILKTQRARMREISDKFFYDNWVISVHMGELVNLIEAWEPYRAARESLGQLFEAEFVRSLVNQNNVKFYRLSKQLQEYLREGWLDDDTVIEHHTKILDTIRESNINLKWLLLHSQTSSNWRLRRSKALQAIMLSNQIDTKALYVFLQNLAEIEKVFSGFCDNILDAKKSLIDENKARASDILEDLAGIFSDTKPMRWIQADTNTKLADMLKELCSRLNSIDFEKTSAKDLTVRLISDIDATRESYSDGKSLQVIQLFMQIKESLLKILKLLALNLDVKLILQSVGDFSYAWRLMDNTFTNHMQQVIKAEPIRVYGIKSIFLKLTSSFDAHLIRIQQFNSSSDLISVSQYYSTKLVSYIRDVLQIIPSTILELVSDVVSFQTNSVVGHMPAKVLLDNLKDYSLPQERFQMLELTYKIAHYAESLLMMQDTTIGLVRIDSKQILEDGIRRELVRRMSNSIQGVLQFHETGHSLNQDPTVLAKGLIAKLEKLDSIMSGYRRSFEYIQDYLFIYGLRIQQEELGRLIKFNVDIADCALQASVSGTDSNLLIEHRSLYQSSRAPIPIHGTSMLQSSFILRTLDEILRVTEPRATIFDEQLSAWYEQKPQRGRVMDLKVFELVGSSLSATGLNGLDQMCCKLLMCELQKFDNFLVDLYTDRTLQSQNFVEAVEVCNNLRNQTIQEQTLTSDLKLLTSRQFISALSKIAPHIDTIINFLLRIGQLQAIRKAISLVVTNKCRYEARNLYNCLETLNNSLLALLKRGSKKSSQQKAVSSCDQDVTLNISESSKGNRNLINGSQRDTSSELKPEASEAATNGDVGYDGIQAEISGSEIGGCDLRENQLIFELTNHLEWIGLSDALNKIYTLALQASGSSEVFEFREKLVAVDIIFLVLLDQCSKFHFSPAISGFIPKQSKSFYETNCTVDGQPLFYGICTVLNHYRPMIDASSPSSATVVDDGTGGLGYPESPVCRLLKLMGLYVKCSLDQPQLGSSIKPNELTLEVANMILSEIELMRLARQSRQELLASAYLPKFLLDTFQFTICHLNTGSNKI